MKWQIHAPAAILVMRDSMQESRYEECLSAFMALIALRSKDGDDGA